MRPPADADMLGVSVPGLKLDNIDDTTPAKDVISGGARHRTASAYLSLEPSETAVLHAASRIFAGYVAAGAVNEGNEKDFSDRAVRLAARMAIVIERYIQSDNEDW